MAQKNTYEAMFLLDAGNTDFDAATEPVRKVLARSEAEVLAFKAWDERKLAYEIAGRKRGLYALVYFKADPGRVVEIEHDCQLDERILRALILRRDHLTDEELNAETPASAGARRAAERRAARQAEEAEAEAQAGEAEETPEAEAQAGEGETEEEDVADEPADDSGEEVVDLGSDEEVR